MDFDKELLAQVAHDLFDFDAKADFEDNTGSEPDYVTDNVNFTEKSDLSGQTINPQMTEDAFRTNVAAKFNKLEHVDEVLALKIKELEDRLVRAESIASQAVGSNNNTGVSMS